MRRNDDALQTAIATVRELRRRVEELESRRPEPVAVIGIGCRFPGGVDSPDSFWELLREGRDAVTRTAAGWGGYLDATDSFDPEFFRLNEREARAMDPQHRLLLEAAWSALADAGLPAPSLAGSRAGVYLGLYNDDYRRLAMARADAIDAYTGLGTISALAANRISYLLDLRGPSLAVNATCSSSLVAIHLACRALRSGECDLALAGGANLILSADSTASVAKVATLAADGRCKAFSADADGMVRAEGCAVVALRPLSAALTERDRIYAVVLGSAVNQDGRSNGITAPSPAAQEDVICAALRDAGLAPERISYVEAHGTGTPVGDPIESEALAAVFPHGLHAGSVKTNFGHMEAAAGVAGFIKTALALDRRTIPPHLHLRERNPLLAPGARRFSFPAVAFDWPAGEGPRCAGVSAFSLGGTNAHVVLAEHAASRIAAPAAAERENLLLLSAASAEALEARVRQWLDWLRADAAPDFDSICYTAGRRSTHFRHRAAVEASSREDAAAALERWLGEAHRDPPASVPPVALAFGGWSGDAPFLRRCCADDPAFREAFEASLGALREAGGATAADGLSFAAECGWAAALRAAGVRAAAAAWRNGGEAAALAVAGVLDLAAAARQALGAVTLNALGTGSMAVRARTDAATLEASGFLALDSATPPREALCRAYLAGHDVYPPSRPEARVCSLPPYPWRRRRFWLDNGSTAQAATSIEVSRTLWKHCGDAEPARVYEAEREAIDRACAAYRDGDPAAGARLHDLRRRAPQLAAELELLERCGPALARIEAAAADPVALLFSGDAAERVYRDSPFARHYHPILIEALASRLPRDRKATVLEVGAGTGGATAAVLEALGDRIGEYAFSDLSAAFFPRALERWGALPGFRCATLDLERDPEEQGFAGRRFDFAIASNSLHTARDPGQSLRRLRRLADHLLLLEGTGNRNWADLTFGLTRGWTGPGGPLLPAREWLRMLRAAGWPEAHAASGPGEDAAVIATGAASAEWAVVGENAAGCNRIVRALGELGCRAARCQSAATLPPRLRGTIAMVGDRTGAAEEVLGGLTELARTLAARRDPAPLWIVTHGAQPAGGPVTQPWQSTAWGFAAVLSREHPELFGGAIDDDGASPAALARMTLELATRPPERRSIALRDRSRYEPRLELQALPGDRSVAGGGAYLITGGLGGVGRHVALWLARKQVSAIVLASRSASSHPEADALRAKLEAAGCRAETVAADVSDRAAVERLLARFGRELPALSGIVHCAGAVRDGVIARLTTADYRVALAAKAYGAWWLHLASLALRLRAFVMFSSAATAFPMTGLAAYTAANAFLDALASYRRGLGLPAHSIAWGGWKDAGMFTAAAEASGPQWARLGLAPAEPEACLEALDCILAGPWEQVTAAAHTTPRAIVEAAPAPSTLPRPRDVRALVRRRLSELLAGGAPERWRGDRSLIELGVDSLTAVELRNLLARDLGIPLPATLAFDCPTLDDLVAYIESGGDRALAGLEEAI
jgi:3-oxoacyl-(acyl-carrier-protein) synthase/acyl carrier protein/SAM-dependent methyltransferase